MNRSVSHAGGGSEGSEGCREDGDDQLDDSLPGVFTYVHDEKYNLDLGMEGELKGS